MTPSSTTPRRALRTTDAARYLGVSPSLLRKMRARGPDDPLGAGPPYIKISSSLIVYEIASLDSWLESHSAGKPLPSDTRQVLGGRSVQLAGPPPRAGGESQ